MMRIVYIAASTSVFAFFFFLGKRVHSGETLDGPRGFIRLFLKLFNILVDTIGHTAAGYLIMALAIFGGIWVAIIIWRDPFYSED